MNRSHFLKSLLGVALIPFVPARKEPGLTMDELCTMASELPAPNKLEPINLEYRMFKRCIEHALSYKDNREFEIFNIDNKTVHIYWFYERGNYFITVLVDNDCVLSTGDKEDLYKYIRGLYA